MDEQAYFSAMHELIQFRKDLDYLPAVQRGKRASISSLDQARVIRHKLEEALGVTAGTFSDRLSISSNYLDLFTHTGSWLTRARTLAPDLFDKYFNPSLPAERPFGFAAGAAR